MRRQHQKCVWANVQQTTCTQVLTANLALTVILPLQSHWPEMCTTRPHVCTHPHTCTHARTQADTHVLSKYHWRQKGLTTVGDKAEGRRRMRWQKKKKEKQRAMGERERLMTGCGNGSIIYKIGHLGARVYLCPCKCVSLNKSEGVCLSVCSVQWPISTVSTTSAENLSMLDLSVQPTLVGCKKGWVSKQKK